MAPLLDLTDDGTLRRAVALRGYIRRMPSWYRDPAAPEPNAPRKIGVTAVLERNGMFLVERRVDDSDVWAFIGGTLEDGESALATLVREVREETGYSIVSPRLLGVFSDPTRIVAYRDGTICRVFSIAFRATVTGADAPRPSEESAGMRFVDATDLAELPFWAIQAPIRDALLDSADVVIA